MATLTPANETTSSTTRVTKEGRRITYTMNVIQQPERARACGSGAKSSADRRPVDPPPIVELRIFESSASASTTTDAQAAQTDITFSYHANFFLFATLEQARSIAPCRAPSSSLSVNGADAQQSSGSGGMNNLTVLTGTPVAGMAYLDRPTPAGYFIFPDLSVRHEGKYRLSFSLFEELKEDKDSDPDTPESEMAAKSAGGKKQGPVAHVSHRLEVKSQPFTVFSAKKFPGLSESTHLSRTVAEQGCRVRIRRDVRMRRRGDKGGKDWDNDYEDSAEYERARRTATPVGPPTGDGWSMSGPMDPVSTPRPRSVSNASNHSIALQQSRRTSTQEMGNAYQQPYGQQAFGPPQTPTAQGAYGSQTGYGPPQQFQTPYMPQQATMQPPPPSYQSNYQQPHQQFSGHSQQPTYSTPQQQYGVQQSQFVPSAQQPQYPAYAAAQYAPPPAQQSQYPQSPGAAGYSMPDGQYAHSRHEGHESGYAAQMQDHHRSSVSSVSYQNLPVQQSTPQYQPAYQSSAPSSSAGPFGSLDQYSRAARGSQTSMTPLTPGHTQSSAGFATVAPPPRHNPTPTPLSN
ncbi:hypothetical protein LTR66_007886, partial [Elasticomyces elasticus]